MTGFLSFILSKEYADEAIQEAIIVGEKNYDNLENKPQINNVTLQGNKSLNDIGVQTLTNVEIEEILD